MAYSIKEIFYTLQGEGLNAGTPAVFVRFSGCNLWSGREGDRRKAFENRKAACPLWCDTDFADGVRQTEAQIIDEMRKVCPKQNSDVLPLVVFTGGEPLLQLDCELIWGVRAEFPNAMLAIETNGTVSPKPDVDLSSLFVCVSPKVAAVDLLVTRGNELKIVVGKDGYDPFDYEFMGLTNNFDVVWISPVDPGIDSPNVPAHYNEARDYVLDNPTFRLSLQTHKTLGLR